MSSATDTNAATIRAQLNHLGPWRSQVGIAALDALVADRDATEQLRQDAVTAHRACEATCDALEAERDRLAAALREIANLRVSWVVSGSQAAHHIAERALAGVVSPREGEA